MSSKTALHRFAACLPADALKVKFLKSTWRCLILTCCIFFALPMARPSASSSQDINKTWEEKYNDELYVHELIEEIIEVKKDWSYDCKSHKIIKIQKEGAKDKGIGDITISYNKNYEEIKKIKAVIINPGGKKLSYKKIQDLAPYSGQPMYSDNRLKVISMPEVLPASLIDYEVHSYTRKPYIPHSYAHIFSLSSSVPIKKLRYQLIIPKDFSLQIKNLNTDIQPKIKKAGGKIIYTWEKENINKIEWEENMPPDDQIMAKIQVSTIKNWQVIDRWYGDLIKGNLETTPQMQNQVRELVAGKSSEQEKAQAIIKYIQDNFRYISMSFGQYNYQPHPAPEVFANKYGDCKDQTIMAIALLKEAGITAYPCLFIDEGEGEVKQNLPMPFYFNHMILALRLNQKLVFTDILVKGYPLGDTPTDAQGAYLFVINGEGGAFERLPTVEQSRVFSEANISIRADGSALVIQKKQFDKDYSAKLILNWKDYTEKERKEFIEKINGRIAPGGKVFENKFENIDKEYKLVTQKVKCEVPKWAEVSGDFMSFNAGVINRSNIFTKKERNFPIWLRYNHTEKTINAYQIPAGFHIENIPPDKKMTSSFLDFSRTYQHQENKVVETQIVCYKRILLPASDYKTVQDFFDQLPQLSKEKIIIKKASKIIDKILLDKSTE